MDFKSSKPISTSAKSLEAKKSAQSNTIKFDVSFIEDSSDRFATPNKLNSTYIRLLGLLAFLVPIPLASNRPVPWALWALVVSVMIAVFSYKLLTQEKARKLRSAKHLPIFACAGIVIAYSLLQTLPLGTQLLLPNGLELGLPAISLNPSATLFGVLRLLTYMAIFFLALEVCTRTERARQLAKMLFFGVTCHALIAMVSLSVFGDRLPWGEKTAYLGSATGTFVNRNSFASFLGMGLLIGFALVLDKQASHRKVWARKDFLGPKTMEIAWYWVCIALIGLCLIATNSRMGTFAALISIFVFLLVYLLWAPNEKQDGGSKSKAIGIFAVCAFVGFGLIVFATGLGERILFVNRDGLVRLNLYQNILALIEARPLMGVGLDTFQIAFPLVHGPDVDSDFIWDLAHNTYLTYWVELGIIVGSLPIFMALIILVRLFKTLRQQKIWHSGVAVSISTLTLVAIHSSVDFSFEMPANTVFLAIVVALGLSQFKKKREWV